MDKQSCTKDVLEKLHDNCLEYSGQIRLFLTVNDAEKNVKTTIKCGREFSVSYSDVFTTVMKDSLPIMSIYYD